jgi:hypothetical protein
MNTWLATATVINVLCSVMTRGDNKRIHAAVAERE